MNHPAIHQERAQFMYIPQTFKEVSSGVYERKEKGDPLSEALSMHYEIDAITMLENDFVHYSDLKKYLVGYLPEILNYYKTATAVGGGSPKLESLLLQTPEIVVMDGFADTYNLFDSKFRAIYNIESDVHIKYLQRHLDRPFKIPKLAGDCVTFVHFLEHSTNWDTVCSWIEKQENDILIYGPNISAATDAGWIHFRPSDHNIFFTIEAISDVGKQCGYSIKSLSYSDDMLIWMRRSENIRDFIDVIGKDEILKMHTKVARLQESLDCLFSFLIRKNIINTDEFKAYLAHEFSAHSPQKDADNSNLLGTVSITYYDKELMEIIQ